MPLVRVDLNRRHAELRPQISDAIHQGLVHGLPMPEDDLFQMFRFHEDGDLVYTTTFPEADRTDIIYIQILLASIYTPADKQRACHTVVANLAKLGLKPDNLLFALTENGDGDWLAPGRDWVPPAEAEAS